jgi:hypothetical protein
LVPCPLRTGRGRCHARSSSLTSWSLRRSATSGFLVEKHLPKEYRSQFTWRQFAGLLKRGAEGQQDVAEVSTALRIVLQLEGVKCQ